jgi:hypothetical protein
MLGRYAPLLLMLTVRPKCQGADRHRASAPRSGQGLIKAMDELTGPERSIKATSGAMRQGLQQQMAADHRLTPAQRQRAVDVMSEELTAAVTEMMREVMPTVYAGMEACTCSASHWPSCRNCCAFTPAAWAGSR